MNRSIKAVRNSFYLLLAGLFLTGCTPLEVEEGGGTILTDTPIGPPLQISAVPLRSDDGACLDAFSSQDLAHVSRTADGTVRMFEANGTGLAVGDLDADTDLDIVLGGQEGPNTVLWNQGNLQFQAADLGEGATRAITIVDVDGNGLNDIILTRADGALNYWRNEGERIFVREPLPGISSPAYVLNWGDTDLDGDLDLVTAPYDAGFLAERGDEYLLNSGSGVIHYVNEDGRFVAEVLQQDAQALTLLLRDLNGDLRPDILVGNDFAVPDYVWMASDKGWQAAAPFRATNHSTMSLILGDVDNDGSPELFGSDMKPYAHDPETASAWAPLMEGMDMEHEAGDLQIMENVLQVRAETGEWRNVAGDWGIAGTGWSWAGAFGDLDSDGFLDLYVVNGMIEEKIFGHLPDHELVEENQAFRNFGGERFEPAPAWRLGSTRSGRSMAMADLDADGDLDIVVNNLRAPAQLFENRLCGGANLLVDLAWPAVQNTPAIGAQLALTTDMGTLHRTVEIAGSYLAGQSSQIHFGFPTDTQLHTLAIQWPDGAVSTIEDLQPDTRLRIERRE